MEGLNDLIIGRTILPLLCRGSQEGMPGCSAPPVWYTLPSSLNQFRIPCIKLKLHALSIFARLHYFGHFPPFLCTIPFLLFQVFGCFTTFFVLCFIREAGR